MINFEEVNGDNEDELIAFLLEVGAIELHGYDDKSNSFVYRVTPMLKQLFPDMFEEHMKIVNQLAFDLWNKGYIEMKFTSEGSPLIMLIPGLDYESIMDKLDDSERNMIQNLLDAKKML